MMINRKRWVRPTFDSFTDVAPPTKKNSTKKVSSSIPETTTPLVSDSEHKSKTWLEKYQPKTVDDLVIHPKKLSEVEEWFRTHLANPQEKYLILLGPCGSGKTASLRVIAKKFDFDVLEWITPLDRDFDSNLHGEDQTYQSAAEVFEQFLLRATRYPSLFTKSKSKIILVKDFPNIFLQDPYILHNILRKYLLLNCYPIAFVCSDDYCARNLIPDAVREECNMRVITFNPVHCKAVIKALERVLKLEKKCNPNINITKDIDLEKVYQNSAGDLRSAILKLYFNVMTEDHSEDLQMREISENITKATRKKIISKRNKTKKNSSNDANVKENTDKDANTNLFHMLGRVIYSKRQHPDPDKPSEYRFEHNPNDLVDTNSSQPYSFISFLQQNYVSRFSCIRSISQAAEKLCHADVMANSNKSTNISALALAIRGIMVANNRPVKNFTPFVKLRSCEDILNISLADEIRLAFPDFQHSPRDVILYSLPLLKESSYQFDDAQKKVLNKLLTSFRK